MMHFGYKKWILGISTLLSFFSANAWGEEKMNLAFVAEFTGDPVHMSIRDVADSSRTDAQLLSRYGDISLPQVGGSGNIQPSHVLLALSRAGVDLSNINLLTSSEVKIVPIYRNDVVSLVKDSALKKIRSAGSQGINYGLELKKIPENLPTRSSFSSIDLEIRDISGSSKTVFVKFIDNQGKTVTTAEFEAEVQTDGKVVVANRPINAGEFVTAADFEEVEREVGQGNYIASLSDLGQSRWQMSQGMDRGSALERKFVNFSSAVKKGSIVTLLSGDKRFQVRVPGRVIEVMDNGATVLVENMSSKKELLGQPVNASEVRIAY